MTDLDLSRDAATRHAAGPLPGPAPGRENGARQEFQSAHAEWCSPPGRRR